MKSSAHETAEMRKKLIQYGWIDAMGRSVDWKYWHEKHEADRAARRAAIRTEIQVTGKHPYRPRFDKD